MMNLIRENRSRDLVANKTRSWIFDWVINKVDMPLKITALELLFWKFKRVLLQFLAGNKKIYKIRVTSISNSNY